MLFAVTQFRGLHAEFALMGAMNRLELNDPPTSVGGIRALSGALNLFRADLGFPERHSRLKSFAPSGAKETNTKFLLRQQEVTDLHYKLQSRYAARLLV